MAVIDSPPVVRAKDDDPDKSTGWIGRAINRLMHLPEGSETPQLGYAVRNNDWPATQTTLSAREAEEVLDRLDDIDPTLKTSAEDDAIS